MEKTSIRKFRWFWPWQDENEEIWLREMSQEGGTWIRLGC